MADEFKPDIVLQTNQIILDTLTVEQLKALAYDEARKLEIARANLQVLNQEIAKKEKNQKTI